VPQRPSKVASSRQLVLSALDWTSTRTVGVAWTASCADIPRHDTKDEAQDRGALQMDR
jgi:hypothetical protein